MSETLPESARRRVGDIMTKQVIKVYPDTRVSEVAQLMARHHISGLPVVDENERVLGVVTELDMMVRNSRFKLPNFFMILDMIIYLETPGHYQERLENILGTTAREIMSEPPITTTPEATIEQLTELMVHRRMNPIPVVEHGRLVGIVSRTDIIRLMAEEFGNKSGE
jgi:CBS-domain-containing membrane protein